MSERWLALDPGGATGWSLWEQDRKGHRRLRRVRYGVVPGGLDGFVEEIPALTLGVCLVICESFELDSRTKVPDLTPKQIEGAIAMWCAQAGVEVHFSQKSQKARVKDDVLKRLDLWITGKPVGWEDGRDVNDSAKHALAFALDCETDATDQPTTRWLYPPTW